MRPPTALVKTIQIQKTRSGCPTIRDSRSAKRGPRLRGPQKHNCASRTGMKRQISNAADRVRAWSRNRLRSGGTRVEDIMPPSNQGGAHGQFEEDLRRPAEFP